MWWQLVFIVRLNERTSEQSLHLVQMQPRWTATSTCIERAWGHTNTLNVNLYKHIPFRAHCAVQTRRWTWRRRFYCKRCHCIIDLIYLIPCVIAAAAAAMSPFPLLGPVHGALLYNLSFHFLFCIFLMYVAYIMCQTHSAHAHNAQRTPCQSIPLQIIFMLISGWYANCPLHFAYDDGFRCFFESSYWSCLTLSLYDQIKLIKSITRVR